MIVVMQMVGQINSDFCNGLNFLHVDRAQLQRLLCLLTELFTCGDICRSS